MTITRPWPRWWRRPAEPSSAGADADVATGFGGDEEPGEWVTVYTAAWLEEAHVVKGALESEGLPVLLRYESLTTLYGLTAMRGVDVQVPRPLEDRARAVLEAEDPGG